MDFIIISRTLSHDYIKWFPLRVWVFFFKKLSRYGSQNKIKIIKPQLFINNNISAFLAYILTYILDNQ